jgi:hypothetical protein
VSPSTTHIRIGITQVCLGLALESQLEHSSDTVGTAGVAGDGIPLGTHIRSRSTTALRVITISIRRTVRTTAAATTTMAAMPIVGVITVAVSMRHTVAVPRQVSGRNRAEFYVGEWALPVRRVATQDLAVVTDAPEWVRQDREQVLHTEADRMEAVAAAVEAVMAEVVMEEGAEDEGRIPVRNATDAPKTIRPQSEAFKAGRHSRPRLARMRFNCQCRFKFPQSSGWKFPIPFLSEFLSFGLWSGENFFARIAYRRRLNVGTSRLSNNCTLGGADSSASERLRSIATSGRYLFQKRSEQQIDLATVEGFFLSQLNGDSLQFRSTASQYCLCAKIEIIRNPPHFGIDGFRRFFAIVAFLRRERKAQELSSLGRTVGQVAKAIAHTEPHHHLTYEFGRALKVVPCSR